MAETPRDSDISELPQARAQPKSRWSFQVVWLIPIVSALIGGWIAVKAIMDRGPTITISFQTAEGLEAGKTKLKYKDVEVGLVKSVTFSKDVKRVIVTAELVKEAAPHLVEDTRFWVVRPRITGGTVTGLGTLLSGSYIGVDTGKSTNARRDFVGLDVPPVVTIDTPGREFTLYSETMASVDSGSPIFYRRLQAGQVMSYALDEDGKGVTLKIFIHAPYDKFVNANTRFWSASGIDVKVDAGGIAVQTESLISILIGGIAFETLDSAKGLTPVAADTKFKLFATRAEAMKNPETDGTQMTMVFKESTRGLAPGAPVDFRGIVVGEVVSVSVDVDLKSREVIVPVDVMIYPSRLRSRARSEYGQTQRNEEERRQFIDVLVANGLRAQLRTGSLITGQLYIALDFFPQARKAAVKWSASPPEVPTTPGATQQLQAAITSVAAKIDQFPLEEIGRDARAALQSADKVLQRVDSEVTPELRQALQSGAKLLQRLDAEVAPEAREALAEARKALASADRLLAAEAPLQQDARETMREIARAAQAFRVLADYLERNPQALLLGKKEDAQ